MAPTFTIVITICSAIPYLRECLNSLCAQTYANWEAVCVGDEFVGENKSIINEYATTDRRFRIINLQNKGVVVARNKALDIARGDWVWFVDANDAIHPNALMWLKNVFEQNISYGVFICSGGSILGPKIVKEWPELSDVTKVQRIDNVTAKSILLRNKELWGVITKRSLIGAVRFSDYSFGEDVLFNTTIFWQDTRTLCLEVPIYFCRTQLKSNQKAPTFQNVIDFLETEYIVLSMMDEHRNLWKYESVLEYFKKIDDLVFCTYHSGIWTLSLLEMSQILDKWFRLQVLFHKLFKDVSLYRKIFANIIHFIPSTRIIRFLYNTSVRLYHSFSKIPQHKIEKKYAMRIGGTYNLFDGEELLLSSIKSVRSVLSYINVVYQNVSNLGVERTKSLREYLEQLKTKGLIDEIIEYKPVLNQDCAWNEKQKRILGMQACQKNGCTHFISMDVDEFYRASEFSYAVKFMNENGIDCTAVSIIEYLRDPTLRLVSNYMFPFDNEDYVFYVPFVIKIPSKIDTGIFPCRIDPTRGFAKGKNFYLFPKDEIAMHHMSHVRINYALKCRNSTASRVASYIDATNAVLKYEFQKDSKIPIGYDFIGNYLVKNVEDEFDVNNGLEEFCNIS